MLVLSRRKGEAVMIGTDVTVVILGINGRQVSVGIEAPKSTGIYRAEIPPDARRNKNHVEKTVVATGTAA